MTVTKLYSYFKRYSMYWVGISDAGTEGVWRYTDGTDASDMMFTWTGSEPDNTGCDEHTSTTPG